MRTKHIKMVLGFVFALYALALVHEAIPGVHGDSGHSECGLCQLIYTAVLSVWPLVLLIWLALVSCLPAVRLLPRLDSCVVFCPARAPPRSLSA